MKISIQLIFIVLIPLLGFSQSETKAPALLWKYQMPYSNCSNALVSDDKIYANCFDKAISKGYQYAINKSNGSVIWERQIEEQLSTPLVSGNLAFYGSKNNKVIALNAQNGQESWQFSNISGAVCTPPVLVNDQLYFGTHTKEWCSINATTGKLILNHKIGNGICCEPTLDKKSVFYTDWDGKLHRFNTTHFTDSVIYRTTTSSHVAPVVKGNRGYMTNDDNSVICVDLKTGKEYWTFRTDGKLWRPPTIADDICMVITDSSHIYAFESTTGKLLWDEKKSGIIYTSATILENIAYVGCGDKNLYAFDIRLGKELWKLAFPENVEKVCIDKDILYFSSGPNVYAYKK